MQIISWNVNGIRAVAKKGALAPLLALKPDIMCFQETKAERGQVALDLPDYEEYWHSATRKGYSGTAIFVKKGLEVHSVEYGFPEDICQKYKLHEDGYGDPNTEGRVITAELRDFYVVTCYTPNSKGDLSRLSLRHEKWDPAFLEFMERLDKTKPVIFCGDLNVAHTPDDLAKPKENEGEHGFTPEEREGVDNMIEAGFVDTFRHFKKGNGFYTWWHYFNNSRARNVGWRIDYVFISKKLLPRLKAANIFPEITGSDHCPVQIVLKDK